MFYGDFFVLIWSHWYAMPEKIVSSYARDQEKNHCLFNGGKKQMNNEFSDLIHTKWMWKIPNDFVEP